MGWDRATKYYVGDGVLMVGERTAAGAPKGLMRLANCSEAKITIDSSVWEQKEFQSGQRGIDLRGSNETKASIEATLYNFERDTLALFTRGEYTDFAAGSATAEPIGWYGGRSQQVQPLEKMKVSSVVVKRGATTLTEFSNDATPWDYKVNTEHGSILWNNGETTLIDKITTGGTAPSGIAVGATTRVTVANTAAVGEYAIFSGFAGADAALINKKALRIVDATATYVDLALDTTGKTITIGTPLSCFAGAAIAVDYSYASQGVVDALVKGLVDRWMRFEGLNRAQDLSPVVLDAFRFQVDPAKEFPIITGDINTGAPFPLSGTLLVDALRTTGSKFYRERLL